MTLQQAFDLAFEHHQAGRFAQAEQLYRQVLAVAPGHADALHLLGLIANQSGHFDAAVDLIRRAIALVPATAAYHSNLGFVLGQRGDHEGAIAALRHALTLDPNIAEAHGNLGQELAALGQLDEAIAAHREAVRLQPASAELHNGLGAALAAQGCFEEAIAAYERALQLAPRHFQAQNNLGTALRARGRLVEAEAALREALRWEPDCAEAWNNLGVILVDQGRLGDAVAAHRRATELSPRYAEAHYQLGVALTWQGNFDEALAACERALELKPDDAQALGSLGNVLRDRGCVDAAVGAYRRALELRPDFVAGRDNLLWSLHHLPGISAAEIFSEHRLWNELHAQPLAPLPASHHHDTNPERRLHVGYVSPDFREHSVAYFLEDLLAHHAPDEVEVFCYADLARADSVTARLRQHATTWRDIAGSPDAAVAELVRSDRIDLLVDLAGHTGRNRLLVFARQPAPVQVSALGYCGTTGLDAIDYRLTDALADPPGMTERFHSERLVRLPECAWCFRAHPAAPTVSAAPCEENGYVTFGCFGSMPKLTGDVLALWAEILRELPQARLRLKNFGLRDPGVTHRTRSALEQLGVATERIELIAAAPTIAEHLAAYGSIDVALDTFPYHGTTTTCEALWMGVPVVTLAGRTHASRVGVSLLTNVELPELIAESPDDYVRRAVALANDTARLTALRATLRVRMAHSPLMDAPGFARKVETAYREMWRTWCATR